MESRLGFSPLTLKDLASSQFGLMCWCNELNNPNSEHTWGNTWFKEHTFHCEDILPVPVEIRPIIKDKIRIIGLELENWLVHHLQIIDFIPRQVMASCLFMNSTFGDICYKRTAQNLLKVNYSFNLREQFKIACRYCFEEDVRRLWPFLKDDAELDKHSFNNVVSRPGHVHTTDYWCSLMRGELIAFYEFGSEQRSPEWYVISNRPSTTKWAEIEYYWNKLDDEDRSTLIHSILADRNFSIHLIFKYNLHKDLHMVLLRPYQTLHNLAENEVYYHYTWQVWNYIKNNLITKKKLFFYRILIKLLPMAFNQPNTHHGDRNTGMVKLIKEIWISTPEKMKNFICESNERVQRVFEMSEMYLDIRFFGRDIGFFIQLLRDTTSMGIRHQIWLQWWRKLITVAKVSDLIELMTLCFRKEDDIVQFKRNTMLNVKILRGVFTQFIKHGYYNEFADYLKFCSSD